MPNRSLYDEKLVRMVDIKLVRESIESPEWYDLARLEDYLVESNLNYSVNLKEKVIRAGLIIEIEVLGQDDYEEDILGDFVMAFVYQVDNLPELVTKDKKNDLLIDQGLTDALTSSTYSTARGFLYARLQGTALQDFILPFVTPKKEGLKVES